MSFLQHLNQAQQEAVLAVDGPVMIVAGAGSGKTRVLTYRAAHLIDQGERPESILALTFTNKAAEEMKGRIRGLVGDPSREIWMGTFHSLFARILRKEAAAIGYGRNFSIYDTDDSLSLVKKIMNSLGVSQQQFNPQGIRSRISLAKNQMMSPKVYRETGLDPMTERAASVYEEYERRLRKCNAMDFDDLLLKPLDLFRQHPEILQRYHYRFKYILVDEYQDTNRVQYLLIKELAAHHRNICVVGDDAQSIYSFRGADIRNILEFEQDYPDCRVFRLEQNYRSTQTILSAADSIIRQNVDQIPKKLWTKNDIGEKVVLTVCQNDLEEGMAIVAQIEEESRREKRDLKDFAVLYRTNAQSRSLEDALRRHAIPYVIVGGVAFYKRKEIKDILAYLRVVVNPLDAESLARIINVPARAIGDTTLEKIRRYAQKHSLSLYDAVGASGLSDVLQDRTMRAVQEFHAVLEKYRGLKEKVSASELARALVDEIGVAHQLKEENTPESLARRENIFELVSALTEFNDNRPGATLEDFLQEVSLVSDVDMTDFGRNAVTLMTIHAAKGLEFPVIFVAGLEEGLFPLSNALEDRKELEEERRLMYVAMTRARQKLYISYAVSRYRYGEFSYSMKSRFLNELDISLVRVSDQSISLKPATPRTIPGGGLERPLRTGLRKPKRVDESAHYFSDAMPDYENESQDGARLRVGARVIHESFGAGRVIALDGRGETARAVVDFESVGRKNLMLKFAHLRPQ
jgi:DNA helicase-2/ATP-dependent DNA helicase PcrA